MPPAMKPDELDLTLLDEGACLEADDLVSRFSGLFGTGLVEGGDFDGGLFAI